MVESLAFVVVGLAAGLLGSLVGLGGGVLIVPVLSLLMGVPIHEAVAASLVAVVATSSSATIGFLHRGLVNLRLGFTLETTMTLGAVVGGLTSAAFDQRTLSAAFAGVLLAMVASLFRRAGDPGEHVVLGPGEVGVAGRLSTPFFDPRLGGHVSYSVRRLPLGLATSLVAGNVSGLLGIGGGVINVPTMTVLMGVPMKAAAATSSFMIGLTAVAGALVYYAQGLVDPTVAAPVALGAMMGAAIGPRLSTHIGGPGLRRLLAVVLFALSIQMALSACGIHLR